MRVDDNNSGDDLPASDPIRDFIQLMKHGFEGMSVYRRKDPAEGVGAGNVMLEFKESVQPVAFACSELFHPFEVITAADHGHDRKGQDHREWVQDGPIDCGAICPR